MMDAYSSCNKPLMLTLGEPGGVGTELALDIWCQRKKNKTPPFVFMATRSFVESRARLLDLDVPLVFWQPDTPSPPLENLFGQALPIFELDHQINDNPGHADPKNGAAVIESIVEAVKFLRQDKASAVITNPIQKSSLYQTGFKHPGHTEFLGELANQWPDGPFKPVMMLAGPELKTIPATLHIALKDVPASLDQQTLIDLIAITERELKSRFNIEQPRIVVTGLNPHAGEEGAMGTEDADIIRPAIQKMQARGIAVTGPHPADTLFFRERRETYDAAIAMYHDQALLPVKTLAFDETVNVTLGLPFVRTSPDHGTALDIAGKGIARPDSLLAALKLADRMANHGTKQAASCA